MAAAASSSLIFMVAGAVSASFTSSPSLLNRISNYPLHTPMLKLVSHKTLIPSNSSFFSSLIIPRSSSPLVLSSFTNNSIVFNGSNITQNEEEFDVDGDDELTLFDAEEYIDDDRHNDREEIVEEKKKGFRSREMGRLYVGNLPYSISSQQLAEVFGEAGGVDSVEIVYDRITDRSRGFGFVTMNTVDDAREATRMFDGAQIGGRTVKVNFPEVPKGGEWEVMGPKIRNSYRGYVDTPHKIYVVNLSWTVTSQDLKEAFGQHSGFLSAKVIYCKDTGKSRGFGFVSFASAHEVQSALVAMNRVELQGRPLKLNLASERAPLSSPPAVKRINTVTSEIIS